MRLGNTITFDFIAGVKSHAPCWIQFIGVEWFYRLCSEPKRLWCRYWTTNSKSVWYFL
jgi:N-acetylglucosaminyldiphosphoundecaprenol N-acetyl-beta-D-mannosaminyltransferase